MEQRHLGLDDKEDRSYEHVNHGSDMAKGIAAIASLVEDPEWVRVLVVPGQPYSKARPRFSSKGRVYTPKKQKANEEKIGWYLKKTFDEPYEGSMAVGCIFYRKTRHRIDVDNLLKQVLDSGNTIAWKDDSQVTAQMGVLELDPEEPRTVIAVAPRGGSMHRVAGTTMACRNCGKDFEPQFHRTKYCSRRCASLTRGKDLRATVPCRWCDKPFKRVTVSQTYCSDGCRLKGLHKKNLKPPNHCDDCGKKLENRLAARCRPCWKVWVASGKESR